HAPLQIPTYPKKQNVSTCQAPAHTKRCSHENFIVKSSRFRYDVFAGWSSLVARWAHNPKVAGSNPAPATNAGLNSGTGVGPLSCYVPRLWQTLFRLCPLEPLWTSLL